MGSKIDELLKKIESNSINGSDVLLFVDAIQELADENEDMQDLLVDIEEEGEEISLNFKVTDAPYTASMLIKDGQCITSKRLLDSSLLTVNLNEATAIEILTQKMSMVQAYQEGNLEIEGNLMQAAGLAIMLNIVGDELGIL